MCHEWDQCLYKWPFPILFITYEGVMIQPSANPKEGRHLNPTWRDCDFRLPSLQNYKKDTSVVYKPSCLWYFVIASQGKTTDNIKIFIMVCGWKQPCGSRLLFLQYHLWTICGSYLHSRNGKFLTLFPDRRKQNPSRWVQKSTLLTRLPADFTY